MEKYLHYWDWEGKIVAIQYENIPIDLLSSSSPSSSSPSSSKSSPRIILQLLDDFPKEYSDILLNGPKSHRPLLCIEIDSNIDKSKRINLSSSAPSTAQDNNFQQYNGLWCVQKIDKKMLYCYPSHISQETCDNLWNQGYYLHKPPSTSCTETNIQFLKYSHDKENNPEIFSSLIIPPSSTSSTTSISLLGRVYFAPTLVFHCLLCIFNLMAIDTINQTFQIDFYTELRLKYFTNHEDTEAILKLLECYHAPPIYTIDYLNVFETINEKEIWTTIESNPQHTHLNDFVIKIRFKAVFIEKMELEDFPFDLQEFNLPLAFNTSIHRVTLRPNMKYPSRFQVNNFQLSSIFEVVYHDIVMSSSYTSNPSESSAGIIYPRCKFTIYLWRKTGYYLSNVILPICVLTLLSPLSCSINDDGTSLGTSDRLGITLTLLLTAVAYKFVVASSLPTVSYLTLLDRFHCLHFHSSYPSISPSFLSFSSPCSTFSYVLICFSFLCINAIENVLFPLFAYHYQTKKSVEWSFVIAYYGSFLMINVIYLLNILYCNYQRIKIRNISLLRERLRRSTAQRLPSPSISTPSSPPAPFPSSSTLPTLLKSSEIDKIVDKILIDSGYNERDIESATNSSIQLQRPTIHFLKYFQMWRRRKVANTGQDPLFEEEQMRNYLSAIDNEIKKLENRK